MLTIDCGEFIPLLEWENIFVCSHVITHLREQLLLGRIPMWSTQDGDGFDIMHACKISMKCIKYRCFISNDLSNFKLLGDYEKGKKPQSFLMGGKIRLLGEAFCYSKSERIFTDNSLAEIFWLTYR